MVSQFSASSSSVAVSAHQLVVVMVRMWMRVVREAVEGRRRDQGRRGRRRRGRGAEVVVVARGGAQALLQVQVGIVFVKKIGSSFIIEASTLVKAIMIIKT